MVQVKKSSQITENGCLVMRKVNGEILKIVVYLTVPLPNVRVQIKLSTEELLIDDTLRERYNLFRPKATLFLSEEQTYVDSYYNNDEIFINIEGLGNNEQIESIAVYYR